jgi:hypothetical protein
VLPLPVPPVPSFASRQSRLQTHQPQNSVATPLTHSLSSLSAGPITKTSKIAHEGHVLRGQHDCLLPCISGRVPYSLSEAHRVPSWRCPAQEGTIPSRQRPVYVCLPPTIFDRPEAENPLKSGYRAVLVALAKIVKAGHFDHVSHVNQAPGHRER